jgi:predicted RNA-binding protein with PUA-like domain
MVDVQAVAALPQPLTRQMLAAHPLLGNMAVLRRGNRLSVQEVTTLEWRAVLAAGGLNADMSEEVREN